jgi:hypothetical protein
MFLGAGFEGFERVEIIAPGELREIGDPTASKSFDDAVGLSKKDMNYQSTNEVKVIVPKHQATQANTKERSRSVRLRQSGTGNLLW